MTNDDAQIARLSDDIRQIFAKARGENSEMTRLCGDHPDPLLHSDSNPVLNISQDEFLGIFSVNSHRYLIDPGQASRFATYCHLPLPNLIAFIMKAEFEHLQPELSGISLHPGIYPKNNEPRETLAKTHIADFKPDAGKIFKYIRRKPDGSASGITFSQVEFIVEDLSQDHRFLCANDNINKFYPGQVITEEIMFGRISAEQKENYLKLKAVWKVKSNGLDEMLFDLERKKKLNVGIENKYMSVFGYLEVEKSDLLYKKRKYKTVMELIKAASVISIKELLTRAGEILIEAEKEKQELKTKLTRSRNNIEDIIPAGSTPVTKAFVDSYKAECGILIKKLYMMLHSDKIPGYSGFTERRKNEINKLWLELMKSTRNEIFSFSPTMLLYSLPDFDHLESIYKKACEILGIDPECYEPGNRLEFLISKGSSIDDILEFLKNETVNLGNHLARLEMIQDEYTNEDQTREYREGLGNRDGHTEKLKKKISDLKIQIIDLRKEIVAKITRSGK